MAKQTFTTGQVLTAAQMTSLQQTAMLGGTASAKTASYVLVAADAGTTISMSNAGSTTITVNTGLFSAGDIVTILNVGAGTCTVTAGTATVSKPTNATLALVQNAGGVLYFTATGAATFLPFDVGATATGFVGCAVSNTVDWTSSTGAYADLTFNTEAFDTDAFHDTSSNTARMTIPTGKTGKYLLVGQAFFGANATGTRAMRFYKNNTTSLGATQSPVSNGTYGTCMSMSSVVSLTAGDYVTFQLYQNSGGNLTIYQDNTYYSIVFLGA